MRFPGERRLKSNEGGGGGGVLAAVSSPEKLCQEIKRLWRGNRKKAGKKKISSFFLYFNPRPKIKKVLKESGNKSGVPIPLGIATLRRKT